MEMRECENECGWLYVGLRQKDQNRRRKCNVCGNSMSRPRVCTVLSSETDWQVLSLLAFAILRFTPRRNITPYIRRGIRLLRVSKT